MLRACPLMLARRRRSTPCPPSRSGPHEAHDVVCGTGRASATTVGVRARGERAADYARRAPRVQLAAAGGAERGCAPSPPLAAAHPSQAPEAQAIEGSGWQCGGAEMAKRGQKGYELPLALYCSASGLTNGGSYSDAPTALVDPGRWPPLSTSMV
jgi:hypothetical protein